MISKFSKTFLVGALVVAAGATLAYAAAGDDAITARQACMKANGKAMGTFVPIMKGEKTYDAAAVAAALTTMETACANWKDFWVDGSQTSTTLKSRALPAVWKDPKGFETASNSYYTAFTALKATKDEAGFKAGMSALGKGCGDCHETFRAPQQ